MSAGQFRPHGAYRVHCEGRLMVVETSGPWNKELIEVFGMEIGDMVRQLAGKPWGVLAIVTKDGMHTPDSFAAVVEGIKVQRSLGRCATAVILRDIEAPSVVRNILTRLYVEAGETAEFFDEETAARQWLGERLQLR